MDKVKLGLKKLNPEQLMSLGNRIGAAMSGNATFPSPIPPMAALESLVAEARERIDEHSQALRTTQMALGLRDTALAKVRAAISQEAAYVESVSAGDRVKIESAGMTVRAPKALLGPMPQVLNLVLRAGDFESRLESSWEPVHGVGSYELQSSPEPMSSGSWVFALFSSKARATLDGLSSGAKVWVRVRAIGAAGPGPWSDPAVKTVP